MLILCCGSVNVRVYTSSILFCLCFVIMIILPFKVFFCYVSFHFGSDRFERDDKRVGTTVVQLNPVLTIILLLQYSNTARYAI